jgi:hypothetical protein
VAKKASEVPRLRMGLADKAASCAASAKHSPAVAADSEDASWYELPSKAAVFLLRGTQHLQVAGDSGTTVLTTGTISEEFRHEVVQSLLESQGSRL